MISVRRRCWKDSLIPEDWGRSRESYNRAATEAVRIAANPTHPSYKAQQERFARRRAKDERFKRELLS